MGDESKLPPKPAGQPLTGSGPAGLNPANPALTAGSVPGLVAYVPVGWLAVVMLLSLRGLVSSSPFVFEYGLPERVMLLIYGGVAMGAVTLVWGLYVLGLAIGRSERFPRHFTFWQVAQLAWLAVREAYVLVTPDFAFSLQNAAMTAIEAAIGLFCLHLVRKNRDAAALYDRPGAAAPSLLVSIVAGILGVVVGGAVGFGVGLGAGVVIAETTDMSCFEGACGFFAFFLGLAGVIVGAIAGCILAVWRTRRRPKAAFPTV